MACVTLYPPLKERRSVFPVAEVRMERARGVVNAPYDYQTSRYLWVLRGDVPEQWANNRHVLQYRTLWDGR